MASRNMQNVPRANRGIGASASVLPVFKHDPCVKNLEPDPRYKALLRKLKLPEFAMSRRRLLAHKIIQGKGAR
jgi:hypothetical protein